MVWRSPAPDDRRLPGGCSLGGPLTPRGELPPLLSNASRLALRPLPLPAAPILFQPFHSESGAMRMLRLLRILRFLRMFRFKRAFLLSLSLASLCVCGAGCSPTGSPITSDSEVASPAPAAASVGTSDRAATVAQHLSGWFTSEAQAKQDESYFNIHLVAIPIWTERTDGHWLYVEQAADGYLDQPYRQRIYHVSETSTGVKSEIYALPDPSAWVAAWRSPDLAKSLTPAQLQIRKGCAVHLTEASPGRFVGSTGVATCESMRQGAAYATSEVILEANRLESWDRGFDANDEQVWGAVDGAYIFDRISDAPRP